MSEEEERELNSIAVQRFGKQLISLDDAEMSEVRQVRRMWLTPAEVIQLEEVLDAAPRERYFADELGGYFADELGFRDPEKAAEHAVMIQGGFSTPSREAARMIADGGVGAERARAWMAEKGYTEADLG